MPPLHDFHALLIIALCAVLCGGQGAVDLALFAKSKEPFQREFLDLKNGSPSHDTFSRLFRHLNPDQFRASFQRFMTAFSETCQGVIAIDCKVLRRSFGWLIRLQCQRVIAPLIDDLRGDGALAVEGIDGHNGALERQHRQQLRHGGDLIGFRVGGLRQHDALFAAPS